MFETCQGAPGLILMPSGRPQRSAWEDRFSQPTEAEALAHYNKQLTGCANAARLSLRSRLGAAERLEWKGVPWRWTFVYARLQSPVEAYLVPLPSAPRLVITIPASAIGPFVDRRAPRVIRDALLNAVRVGENLWPGWDLTVRAHVVELSDLLDRLRQLELAAEGAA